MDTYTVTLTREEMLLLINATNVVHLKYKHPEMTEAARKGAQDYADLCGKLYYKMMDEEVISCTSIESRLVGGSAKLPVNTENVHSILR